MHLLLMLQSGVKKYVNMPKAHEPMRPHFSTWFSEDNGEEALASNLTIYTINTLLINNLHLLKPVSTLYDCLRCRFHSLNYEKLDHHRQVGVNTYCMYMIKRNFGSLNLVKICMKKLLFAFRCFKETEIAYHDKQLLYTNVHQNTNQFHFLSTVNLFTMKPQN